MFRSLLERLSFKKRRAERRRLLADRLLERLERAGSLVLDRAQMGELGAGERQVLLAVCDLLLAEKIHLRATDRNRLNILSNSEFTRLLLRLAQSVFGGEPLREARTAVVQLAEPAPVSGTEADGMADMPELIVLGDDTAPDVPSVFPVATLESDAEFEWFTLDVADAADDKEKLPAGRQSLPSRPREPYVALDENKAEVG